MRFGLLLLFCFFFLFLHCWHYDVNRGASVFIWFPLYQLTSKASIVMPRAL